MPESYIQLPVDGPGKRTRTIVTTKEGREVHQQVVKIADKNDEIVNPAREDGNLAKLLGLSGEGTDITFVLELANTAYPIPPVPPIDFYTLIIYNGSDADIYFRFTEGTTAGVKIASDSFLSIDLGPNQQVYVYCKTAGKIINISYKII